MIINDIFVVYSTFPDQSEAFSVSETLLEKRLVACVNIYEQATSLYRWDGKIQKEKEVIMVAKTTKHKLSSAIDTIESLHSYKLPCIVAYPVTQGSAEFIQWVSDETK